MEGPPKKKSCSWCKKRLHPANEFPCMCDGIFCAMHRYMEAHKCPKIQTKAQEEKEYLKTSLVKVEFSKMESL
jgi:predicted nucleic acid binding AN1-type Zn finger protein